MLFNPDDFYSLIAEWNFYLYAGLNAFAIAMQVPHKSSY